MSLEALQGLVFEEGGQRRGPLHSGARDDGGPRSGGGRGEVVPPPPPLRLLLLLLLMLLGFPHTSSSVSPAGARRRRSQQLPDFLRGAAAPQVLPGLLPRVVPPAHVGLELSHQQPHHALMAVHGGHVQRGVAARRPGVHVQVQAGLLHAVPEGPRTSIREDQAEKKSLDTSFVCDVLDIYSENQPRVSKCSACQCSH